MKTYCFYQTHLNPAPLVDIGYLPKINRVSTVVLSCAELVERLSLPAIALLNAWLKYHCYREWGSPSPSAGCDAYVEVAHLEAWATATSAEVSVEFRRSGRTVTSADQDLDADGLGPDRVTGWLEDAVYLRDRVEEEAISWVKTQREEFDRAVEALQRGDASPIETLTGKTIEDIRWQDYSGTPVVQNGPHGVYLMIDWNQDALPLRKEAELYLQAREEAQAAALTAAKQARRDFQVRWVGILRGSPEDCARASKGFFPPDELAEMLVGRFIPSAKVLRCDGVLMHSMSLSAEEFRRMSELEREFELDRECAEYAGLGVDFRVAEATWDRCYEDEPAVPVLLVTVKDLFRSDWTRTVRVSLFPHSSTQSE